MKKIIAISDSHGNIKDLRLLTDYFKTCDYIFHLGDHDDDMRDFMPEYGNKIIAVKGNCDFGGEEFVFDAEGFRIMLVHGNKYHVKRGLYPLVLRAKELKADAVFFGHTHKPEITEYDGIMFINPGAMSRFGEKTFCVAELDGGVLKPKILKISV